MQSRVLRFVENSVGLLSASYEGSALGKLLQPASASVGAGTPQTPEDIEDSPFYVTSILHFHRLTFCAPGKQPLTLSIIPSQVLKDNY